jgi:hypothetical protein
MKRRAMLNDLAVFTFLYVVAYCLYWMVRR